MCPDPLQQLRKLCAVDQPDVSLASERARAIGNFARGDIDALMCLARSPGVVQVAQRIDAGARGFPTLATDQRDASRLGELEVGRRAGETAHGVAVIARTASSVPATRAALGARSCRQPAAAPITMNGRAAKKAKA